MTETPKYHLALPKSGKGPGVLVLHAWWGLNDFFKSFCDRLADEGFIALAPDLFRGRIARTIPEAESLNPDMNEPEDMPPLVLAAYEELSKQPGLTGNGLATIGFSFGAYWARWLKRSRNRSRPSLLFTATAGIFVNPTLNIWSILQKPILI
jgi:carboxymethylenebutenolidase